MPGRPGRPLDTPMCPPRRRRLGLRLSRKGRNASRGGDAGGWVGVSVSAWSGGVAGWGLVSGPCGGELVAVELAEVLGHHQ